jgi:hypothetical protein
VLNTSANGVAVETASKRDVCLQIYIPCRVIAHLQWLHVLLSAKCLQCSPALAQQCLSDDAALLLSPLLKAVDNVINSGKGAESACVLSVIVFVVDALGTKCEALVIDQVQMQLKAGYHRCLTLLAPICNPLYTCTLSADTISPPRALQTRNATLLLPVAVGPLMQIIFGLAVVLASMCSALMDACMSITCEALA